MEIVGEEKVLLFFHFVQCGEVFHVIVRGGAAAAQLQSSCCHVVECFLIQI